jgi:hypothetical protein
MNNFDIAINSFAGYPGYVGNPPSNQDEYNQLEWRGNWSKPTWENLQIEIAKNSYQRNRAKEYPPITDYIDGVVKGDQAQIDKYIADCQAVKAKYPKGAA